MGRMIRPLDEWISRLLSVKPLTRNAIEAYQLMKLNETLQWATSNSPFYREKYGAIRLNSLTDLQSLPFTCPDDLRARCMEMVCVPQSMISRIVTLDTSGTTGRPKRVFFTKEDQELTIDFFHNGMQLMVDKLDNAIILMPCATPGSVGDLLKTGLERIGTSVIAYGLPKNDFSDANNILNIMENEGVTAAVALPTHLAKLAKMKGGKHIHLRCVLLSAEYASEESRQAIEDHFNCLVFEHFGMTETGLGGAVSCAMLEGYHPREADLYFEIIDPVTGDVLPDGKWGELVFTTLTRKGMPLIRYRTGDTSRWLTEDCACGSVLKRLDRVGDRKLTKGTNHA